MTLDVDGLRLHVTTPLEDEALQGLLDAAYDAIAERYGSSATSVNELLRQPAGDLLMLSRRATAITTLVEGDTTLAANDYELRSSGQTVRRLEAGTHPALKWQGRIDITYAIDEDAERDRVAIQLVKLDLDHAPGLASERVGDHWETYATAGEGPSYAELREQILSSLGAELVLL